jgi:uncharacterized membrane protein HdeD (DUF308 family)
MSRDMSAVPPPERDRKLSATGTWLLIVGLVIVALAVVLLLAGTSAGIAAAIGFLGALPLIAGLVLIVSSVVSRRSRAGKPFA